MPQSKKDLRKLKQRNNGGPQEDPVKSAKKALVEVHCKECAVCFYQKLKQYHD